MSRFEEVVNEAIDEVVLGEAFKAETLAAHIAERVRERQGGRRAEVTHRGALPRAQAGARLAACHPGALHDVRLGGRVRAGTRRLVGVQAQGMTACPCAQELVTDRARSA